MLERVAEQAGGLGARTAGARRPVIVTLAVLSVGGEGLVARLQPVRGAGGPWCLPQRLLDRSETLDAAARDEALRRLPGAGVHVEQLRARSVQPEEAVEVGYLVLVPLPSAAAEWRPLSGLPALPSGQAELLDYARRRLQRKLDHTPIARSLLPAEFSLSELQRVYEAVQERSLDKRNFRKWVLGSGLVQATARLRRDGAHRPARLYRFAEGLTTSAD
jgi:8-oxo-dGTP diphosphatase